MARSKAVAARTSCIAALAVAVVAMAGCSSSKGGNSGGNAGSSGGAIKIMDITTVTGAAPLPDNITAVRAAVKAVNDAGGINGRKLDLTICDDKYDPNVAVACARKAGSDKDVAVVGANSTFDGVFTALAQEKIAVIGGLGTATAERTSATSFPLSGSQPGYTYGAADVLAKAGVTKPAYFACNIPACVDAGKLYTTAMKGHNLNAKTVLAPPQQPDYAAAAASVVSGGTDGVFIASFPTDLPKMIKALHQVGYTGKIATYSTLAPQSTISALGKDAEGLLIVGAASPGSDSSNAGIQEFLKDIKASAPGTDGATLGDIAVTAWAAVKLFAKLATTLKTVDTASVLDAMNNLNTPIDVGVTAPYSVTGKTPPMSDQPRIFNPTMVYSTVQGGKVATQAGFVDPFKAS